jgi:hypothetical protein
MKKQIYATPVLMTAALASMIASSLSCGKTTSVPDKSADPANSPVTDKNAVNSTTTNWTSPAVPAAAETVSNSTVHETKAASPLTDPATPELAPTAPALKPDTKTVEMPEMVPVAPKKFYSADYASTTNHTRTMTQVGSESDNYFFRLRAGYQHTYHGDNNDTWYAGVKFYAHPDDLRASAGKNAWLVPDADVEFSHQVLAKPDNSANPGSAQGLNLRASFFWPWVHWTTRLMARENRFCPYSEPLEFTFGPTMNFGFDYLFEDNHTRFARYFGARMAINRDAFVEYTLGATDGLDGTRQQALAELPFYVTRDRQVRYVFRGLWNRGDHSKADVLSAGVFLEMPVGLLAHPRQWGDLIPFVQ